MELFDVLDCTGRKTGQVMSRDEAHRAGTWHGAFHCLAIYQREGRGYALFQKRSARKKIAPGRIDVTVGGHYAAGEDASLAGPREISEETGLPVRFDQLLPVGRRIFVYCFTPGAIEYEFQDVYLLPLPGRPEAPRLQEEEVDCLLEIELEAAVALFTGRLESINALILRSGAGPVAGAVRPSDFVSCLDNYYLKLLILARRYFAGERDLLVI